MSELYKTLAELCEHKGISGYRMCKDLGIQPSIMTDLKMGRRSSVKAETAQKIANYFGVSVSHLLGWDNPEKPIEFETTVDELSQYIKDRKKAPTQEGECSVSDDDIKFALFGGDGEITDAMFEEVKRFAHMVKLREEADKKKE